MSRLNTANMTKLFAAVGTVSGNPIFKLSAPGACSCSVVEKQTDFTPYTRFNLVVSRQIAVLVSQMRTEARRIASDIAKLPDLLG